MYLVAIEAEADSDTNKVATPGKIKILMGRAERAVERLKNIIAEIGEEKYEQEFKECEALLKGAGHFCFVRTKVSLMRFLQLQKKSTRCPM